MDSRTSPISKESQINSLNLKFLQVELKRVDLLIRKAVRRWQLAGQDESDSFRGLHVTLKEAVSLADRSLGSNWGAGISLPAQEEALLSAEETALREQSLIFSEKARSLQTDLRLTRLVDAFGLSPFEYDAFLICLAPVLDLRYERLFGFLQDDISKKSPSVSLILDLLLPAGLERLEYLDPFHEQRALIRWGLLASDHSELPNTLLRRQWIAAPEIVAWLLGTYRPAAAMADQVRLLQPPFSKIQAFPQAEDSFPAESLLKNTKPLLAFFGADQQRQLRAAQDIAERLSQPLLCVDFRTWKAGEALQPALLRFALRDATLSGAVPYLTGLDGLLNEEGTLPKATLDEINWFNGPVIASSASSWRITSGSNGNDKPFLQWQFDLPSHQERFKLWQYYLGNNGTLNSAGLDALAKQFTLTSVQIHDATVAAKNLALQLNRPLETEDLFEAARQQTSHHLDNLAVKIEPRYSWEDIVLPDEEMAILKEITATVRERPLVLDTWGLGKKLVPNAGIAVLFAGPPGTGKTLAAQVIAASLGMDLYKVDLSTVVSKYVGETEKNLERIFSQARHSNTILFFDEADAIFGKRSEVKDAHDRYANIEVGYLLQRIESFDGVVILATNLRSNLDDAFIRRLQFIVDFPFPDENQRLNIWKVLFPPGVPRDEQIDFELVAGRFKLSGGSIRNAIVCASFLAANEGSCVTTQHILHGVRRELQKMGRLIHEKDLTAVKP